MNVPDTASQIIPLNGCTDFRETTRILVSETIGSTRDIDTSHSMSSEAAKYLRYAKQCAKAAEQTTDPKVRERLLKVVADLTAAALSAASSGTTRPKPGSPSRAA